MNARCFIIGVCIGFMILVGVIHHQDSNKPVVKEQRVENSVNLTDLCGETTGLRVKTTFESDVWCYDV